MSTYEIKVFQLLILQGYLQVWGRRLGLFLLTIGLAGTIKYDMENGLLFEVS